MVCFFCVNNFSQYFQKMDILYGGQHLLEMVNKMNNRKQTFNLAVLLPFYLPNLKLVETLGHLSHVLRILMEKRYLI